MPFYTTYIICKNKISFVSIFIKPLKKILIASAVLIFVVAVIHAINSLNERVQYYNVDSNSIEISKDSLRKIDPYAVYVVYHDDKDSEHWDIEMMLADTESKMEVIMNKKTNIFTLKTTLTNGNYYICEVNYSSMSNNCGDELAEKLIDVYNFWVSYAPYKKK